MKKEIDRFSNLYVLLMLVVYSISIIPSFIPHEHGDLHDHNHNELSYCESITENLSQHIDCSHKHHLNNLKEDCFLCEYFSINDYLFSLFMIESKNRLITEQDYELCKRLNLRSFINYLNKSPPILI